VRFALARLATDAGCDPRLRQAAREALAGE